MSKLGYGGVARSKGKEGRPNSGMTPKETPRCPYSNPAKGKGGVARGQDAPIKHTRINHNGYN